MGEHRKSNSSANTGTTIADIGCFFVMFGLPSIAALTLGLSTVNTDSQPIPTPAYAPVVEITGTLQAMIEFAGDDLPRARVIEVASSDDENLVEGMIITVDVKDDKLMVIPEGRIVHIRCKQSKYSTTGFPTWDGEWQLHECRLHQPGIQ